ncbi:hypothetical protein GCM10009557_06450 [Virgisporangium ochraceum]|uniref:Uncharacterized protein n=1 Tax=Virgisporangium ochraceum TaxID=65505 RepID=A0A8J3ZKE5_9ACTN|nr:hypothetical protein [Virgisporangium ochraceum]GIJ65944.1 hypothetical protein Voc01_008610 [Virgisporangium ochraceum]
MPKIEAPGETDRRADSLAIMAMKVVEVRECDRCGKEPAHTWVITGPEGATREIELCDRHAAAVANAFALGRAVAARATRGRPARRATTTRTGPASPNGSASPNGKAKAAPPEPEPIWR